MAIVGQCLVCFEEIRNGFLFAMESQTFLVALGYYTVGVALTVCNLGLLQYCIATRCYPTMGVALTVYNLGLLQYCC